MIGAGFKIGWLAHPYQNYHGTHARIQKCSSFRKCPALTFSFFQSSTYLQAEKGVQLLLGVAWASIP